VCWRKLLDEEFGNFHSSPKVIMMIRSRKARWTGRVAGIWMRSTQFIYEAELAFVVIQHRIRYGRCPFADHSGLAV
jgi:hypothetical protein